jgi:hypothetical protein
MKKLFLLLFLTTYQLMAQKSAITPKNVEKHIAFLASDALKGRGTGTKDEQKAADYIANHWGLNPKGPMATNNLLKPILIPFMP